MQRQHNKLTYLKSRTDQLLNIINSCPFQKIIWNIVDHQFYSFSLEHSTSRRIRKKKSVKCISLVYESTIKQACPISRSKLVKNCKYREWEGKNKNLSSGLVLSSTRSNTYWNPEHPPVSTLKRSIFSRASLACSCFILYNTFIGKPKSAEQIYVPNS